MVAENIRREVARVLDRDRSGHGVDHVARVVDLALKFAKQEQANAVCHVFDKLLRIKGMMLTAAGRVESESRHEILVDFLEHLFVEDDAPEWSRYLKEYLRKLPE